MDERSGRDAVVGNKGCGGRGSGVEEVKMVRGELNLGGRRKYQERGG